MTVSVTLAASPYKGLAAFGETDLDALFFFGREHEVEVIAANLLASRLTVLYGPTGVGKSSVLRAGVVRALRAVPFPRAVVVFDRWTDAPAHGLAEAVAAAAGVTARASLAETLADAGAALDGEVYVVLDQLEEHFVYHAGGVDEFAAELGTALAESGIRANVLLCLREDALAKLDVLKTRVPGLFSNYLRLDHLDRDAARSAIVGPVERWNEVFGGDTPVAVEPQLVEAVLDQVQAGTFDGDGRGRGGVGGAAGEGRIEAPYLQLVLERLWEVERGRSSSTLRARTLAELGGAGQIVRDHLLHALGELAPVEQATAASLFHHLVTPSGTKIAHSAGDLARYAAVDEEAVGEVTTRLVGERILRPVAGTPGGEARFEIFHDVLAPAVLAWGTRFEARRAEAQARRVAEARHRRATLVAAASLLALLVVAAVAVFALAQRSHARAQARAAHANELTAQALLLQSSDPGAALSAALAASRLEPDAQTEAVLRSSLMASRLRESVDLRSPVEALAWLGVGRVAVGTADGRVSVWATAPNRIVATYRMTGPVRSLSVAPGGDRLLVLADGVAAMAGPGAAVRTLRTHVTDAALGDGGRLAAVADGDGVDIRLAGDGSLLRRIALAGAVRVLFAPDGRTLAVVRQSAPRTFEASTYDVASGTRLATLSTQSTRRLVFSGDSRLLAVANADKTVTLWQPRSGVATGTLDDKGESILDLAFDPTGTMLATASSDGGVRVWRLSDRSRFFYFVAHRAAVTHVTFAPDGAYLASTSADRTVRIWSLQGVEAGTLAAVLAGSRGAVSGAAFAPGGHSLATGSADGVARLWEPRIEQALAPVADYGPRAQAVRVTDGALVMVVAGRVVTYRGTSVTSFPLRSSRFALASGNEIATAAGRTVTVQAVPGGRTLATLAAPAWVTALAFRADGRELAAAAGSSVVVWRVPDGTELHRLAVGPGVVRLALAPAGDLVATGTRSGEVRLWSTSGRLLHVLRFHHRAITDLRFDASGAQLVTAAKWISENAAVWDTGRGTLIAPLVGHFGTVTAASFSPDGRFVLTAGPIAAGIWTAATGELLFYVRLPSTPLPADDLLTDAEWAPSGFLVATSERAGIVREYRCDLCRPLPGLQALAEERLAAGR